MRAARLLGLLLAVAIVWPYPDSAAAPACTITWDGGAGTTAWATPANWNPERVPVAGDVVCIDTGATVVHSTGTTTIQTLLSQGSPQLTGGTLTLTGSGADESSVGAFLISGGTLAGAGTLAVSGTLSWTGGTMRDAGTTRIAVGATLAHNGTVLLQDGRLLEIEGRLELQGGGFIDDAGVAPLVHNSGTIEKTSLTALASIFAPMENDGVVRSAAGTLSLQVGDGPGSSAGDFGVAAAAGSVVFDAGTFDLADGARLLGGVEVSGATVNVVPAATATASGANSFSTGTLGGTGVLAVSGTLSWTGGTMRDAGTTRIAVGATLAHNGTVLLQDGRLLEIEGRLELQGGGFIDDAGVAPLVHNSGTIEKTSLTALASIFAPMENDGVVRSAAGTLSLQVGDGPGSSAGDFGVAAAAGSVVFDAGTFDLADGARLLGGVEVSGATVNVVPAATATASGANSFSTGTLGGTGVLAVSGTLSWTGGTMRDAGTTRIAVGATLAHNGTVLLQDGRLLEIEGRLELQGGGFIDDAGVAPLVHNSGTIEKTSLTALASIFAPMENDGVVRSAAGTLSLQVGDGPGSSAGDFGVAAAAGSVVFDAGTFDLADGARLLGGVEVSGATVNVVPAATATASGANSFSTGTLGGTGVLAVSGTLSWTGGTMRDAGTTRIAVGATLGQQGNVLLQDGRLLENAGRVELRTDGAVSAFGVASLVHNTGTIEKTGGAGTSTLSARLDNDGVIKAALGVMSFTGGDGNAVQNGVFGGGAGTVQLASGTYHLGAGTALVDHVRLSGARLTLLDGVVVAATGPTEFASGFVDGPGTLRVAGAFSWTGGTMEGTGTTLVPAGQEVVVGNGCCPSLAGTRNFRNEGTLRFAGGQLDGAQTARLENPGRIEFGGVDASEGLTDSGRLVNSGAIVKTAGTGESLISMRIANSGTVESQAGTLTLAGGDGDGEQSGSFGGSGGEVRFDFGAYDLAQGSRFKGGVVIDSASITVPAGVRLVVEGTAELSNGQLLGPGDVEVTGALTWTGGSMEAGGQTTIASGGQLKLDGTDDVELVDGRVLVNHGTVTWLGPTLTAFDATIFNDGTIDFQGDGDLSGSLFFERTSLHNVGLVRKSGGVGESELTAELDNDGTIEGSSGTLALRGLLNHSAVTKSLTAGAYVARNATLELPGEPLVVNAATIVLDGPSARLRAREFVGVPDVDALTGLARNAGAGELRLANGADLTTTGPLRNAGLVSVGVDSTLTAGGAYTQAVGRTELTDPTARLVAASYAQSGGRLAVETAQAGVGQVNVAGAAVLAGELSVATRAGFVPTAGSTFRFLQAGSRSSTFSSLDEVAQGIDYTVDYDGTGAALRVVGVGAAPAPVVARPPAAPASAQSALDDRLLAVLSGPWTRKSSPGFYEGTYTMSSKRGARLVRAGIEARYLGLLISTCRGCGSLEAYWNGRLLRRIPLRGKPVRKRVTLATFPSVQTGTLVLRVASHRQVRIDGLVATR